MYVLTSSLICIIMSFLSTDNILEYNIHGHKREASRSPRLRIIGFGGSPRELRG